MTPYNPVIRPISNDYKSHNLIITPRLMFWLGILVLVVGLVGFFLPDGPPLCELVDPADVPALDYENGWYTYANGERFGSAPSDDSPITPMSCYTELDFNP